MDKSERTSRAEVLAWLAVELEILVGYDGEQVTEDKTIADDLGIDSLALAELEVIVEQRWRVPVPIVIERWKTVGDIVDHIAGDVLENEGRRG